MVTPSAARPADTAGTIADPLGASGLDRGVLDRLIEGCQIVGFDWRYLYLNDSVVAQARRPRAELLGRTMQDCYPGIERSPMFAPLERCMRERVPGQAVEEFPFPDGSRLTFELHFVPVPQGVCILSLDVTDRHHRLAAIVNDSADAIIGRTLDGIVTQWNRSAERIFGYRAEEMIGRSIQVLFPQHDVDEDVIPSERLLRGERIEPFETVRLRKDGSEVEVSLALSPIRDSAGNVVGISKIARDISDLKETQRQLERAKESLEAANRDLESFSYSVAHDLRAPLRGIDGFSQALLEDCSAMLDEDGRRRLLLVRSSAQLMARLIDDMLTLARVTRGEFARSPVDLTALGRDILQRLRLSQPGRSADIAIHEGMTANADPHLLAIVLENLLGNAWKFTAGRDVARIELGSTAREGRPVFFVRDNGAGFDPAYSHKLFGAFQRLHGVQEFEGTGIGLATVQRVVRRHHGEIWAEGAVNQGATFYFTLGDEEHSQ